ncbi:MAG: hypothetical protein QOF02_1540 [Blastocatellia bacterium]|jgi:hypothetical protein|nr:hypothetical protein [Blastocatellia bacterium]
MRNRLSATNVRQLSRRRRIGAAYAVAALLFFALGFAVLNDGFQTSAAATPMQLVRLNVAEESGMVRIEITADGSFGDAVVEQLSRGRETVIRIRGARSLLRPSYAINDELAGGVRVHSGERDGEPYVDVSISLGNGATLAQKRSFNRLIIGIATDFARLRRRAPTGAGSGGAELARRETKTPRALESNAFVARAAEPPPAPASAKPSEAANVNPLIQLDSSSTVSYTPVLASIPKASLRSRPLWNRLPNSPLRLRNENNLSRAEDSPLMLDASVPSAEPSILNFVPMTIEAPGATRGAWVPGTTTATEDNIGGRAFGAGVLRPSFLFGALFNDNYFYRSTEGRNMGVFTFAPRIEYEIPGEERALRLAYEARLRKLSNGKWANGHLFDFDMRADLTSSIRLGVRDHFVRSALDPREYDPAGEVYIVGDTFSRNDFDARFDFAVGQRNRIGLDLGSNIVRWSKSHIDSAPLFIDYEDINAALSFERDISEETTATLSFSFTDTNTSAPLRPQFNGLSDHRRYALEIGGRTKVTETSGLALRAGYERSDYRNAPDQNDFNSLVFDLLYRSDLTEKTNLQFAALRKTQVSTFNLEGGNARLVTTGGSARLETAARETVRLALSLYYQRLGFPVAIVPTSTASGGLFVGDFAGERRTDHLYGFNLEASYRWSDLLLSRLVYSFSRRDSTIPVLTFNTNRLSLVFELGRRNEARGRPF